MVLVYGLDNLLINQRVDNYFKNNNFSTKNSVVTYYLEPESFDLTIEKILNESSSLNLFGEKKIIVICDYYLVLNNNQKILAEFIIKLNQFSNGNIIILKILADKLNQQILTSNMDVIHVKSYNKEQIKKWIIEKNFEYKIQFNENTLDFFVNKIPNSLSIIENELKKLKNLKQPIDLEKIKYCTNKYFSYNPYHLINAWLAEDYFLFWLQYRSYWEKVNYDKLNLFSIVTFQLELIRNIKLLVKKNLSNSEIINRLNISIFQLKNLLKYKLDLKEINQLLLNAHEWDFQIKSGKITKNLAIDLFFCKI